ncbi:MAG TPA: IPTL-CTERM sorting domain-containing protein [Nitrospirae bacterium]|nr:IPTL-CTERM sorting domain-containing protein [Nitrospirota bacterium]
MAGKKKTAGFERRLRAYSAAAAGLLVLAPAADAAIRYSGPQSITVDSGNPLVFVDIDNDGTSDFAIKYFMSSTTDSTTITYEKGHMIIGYKYSNQAILAGSYPFVDNLPSQYLIKSSLSSPRLWKYAGFMDFAYGTETSKIEYGNFLGTKGCIGVRFQTSGGTRYGWIGYGAAADAGQGTITGWAYEDTGAPIRACDTGLVTTVPTLNRWGMMALIALLAGGAVTTLRRRERFSV